MRLAELHIPAVPLEIEQPANTHPATERAFDTFRAGVRIKTWCGALHERINVAMYARREVKGNTVELADPMNTLTGEQPGELRPFCEKCKEGHVHYVLKNNTEQPKEDIPF